MKVSIFSLKGLIKEANRVISIVLLSTFLALTGRWSFVFLEEKYDLANAEEESGRVLSSMQDTGARTRALSVSAVYMKRI